MNWEWFLSHIRRPVGSKSPRTLYRGERDSASSPSHAWQLLRFWHVVINHWKCAKVGRHIARRTNYGQREDDVYCDRCGDYLCSVRIRDTVFDRIKAGRSKGDAMPWDKDFREGKRGKSE